MNKKITIIDARKMSMIKIETQLKEYAKVLEDGLDIDHESACQFLSNVMNLAIAGQEKKIWYGMKQK